MKNLFSAKKAAVIIPVIVLASGGYYLWHKHHNSLNANQTFSVGGSMVTSSKGINYGPPTAAEKAESSAANNAAIAAQNNQITTPTNSKRSVTVFIVNSSQSGPGQSLYVSAYVSGIIEDGGTCTLTLIKQGAPTITKTSTGFSDATKTDCPPFNVAYNDFSQTGNWTATVSYSSSSANGTTTKAIKIE